MIDNYEKLFNYIESPDLPLGLFSQVIGRLKREERLLHLKRRATILALGAIISALALIPAGQMVWAGFSESGFFQFFSLLFSDAGIVLTYWQSFGLSLLETLPAMSLIILLTVILAFVESLKSLIKDTKIIFNLKKLISN